ncbi:hypothetical protein BTR23_21880 [Alkalihalophilus pseudofirmus]|nr:hypothetical protein BTR23_21880 [Alkalihalophilus pseudofirmus]
MLEKSEVRILKPFNYSGKNRFLVMARVGDTSLHKEWLHPKRNFDLFLEYFGDGRNNYKDDCDFYTEAKNSKWPRFHNIIEDFGDHIFKYDAVWMPDDDISTDCSTIHHIFDLFTRYNLSLAQPALSEESYYSHKITKQLPGNILRYTNFVEVMVPLFSREALQLCWHSFKKSKSGWGLDSIWPKILGNPINKIAIIDEITVKHTRPLRKGTLYQDINYSASERKEELERICKEYGVKSPFNFKTYRRLPQKKTIKRKK